MQKKDELRDAIKQRLVRMRDKDRAAESRSLCKRLLERFPTELNAVCGFMPMSDEVDIRFLLQELLKGNVPVFLPRFESGRLTFRRARDLSDLQPGVFGTLEPAASSEEPHAQTVTIVLVPGRAFDRKGGRLGRGNGGYDHWIALRRKENPKTVFWGVCYECQLVQEVPQEAHDERVDAVVTARGAVDISN